MTRDDVMNWLHSAEPGDKLVYYTGRCLANSDGRTRMAGRWLLEQFERHKPLVHLVQKRLDGSEHFDFIAVKALP